MAARDPIAPADTDILVIGAGLNGLICAILLAQSKQRVTVLEAQDRIGGLADTREFADGFRASQGAHWAGPLDATLLRQLRLNKAGLTWAERRLGLVALSKDGHPIVFDGNIKRVHKDISHHSPQDARNWAAFESQVAKDTNALAPWAAASPVAPPSTGTWPFTNWGQSAKTLAAPGMLGQFALRSMADWLEDAFETPLLAGALAFDAALGTGAGPRAPGSALHWLLRRAGQAAPSDGIAIPQGGMGAFARALERTALALGVKFRTKARVSRILVAHERAEGVELDSSERVYSPVIVSSLDPAATLLQMVGPRRLPLGLKRAMKFRKPALGLARVNLALGGLPQFRGLDPRDMRHRLIICPSVDYLERAGQDAAAGRVAEAPALEVLIPTVSDPGLAPSNQHVVTATVAHVPGSGLSRAGWDGIRDELMKLVINTLAAFAPDLPARILAGEVLVPPDFERAGGRAHPHWASSVLPQQPLAPMAQLHRSAMTPFAGLYLCADGVHGAAGANGLAGRNAAYAVLDALASERKRG